MTYEEFLKGKELKSEDCGLSVDDSELNNNLFPYQRDIVKFSLKKGRSAVFTDCGTGKTAVQLDFARIVSQKTSGKSLIIAPLSVVKQTQKEGWKFGIDSTVVREQSQVRDGINITNYEILDHFDTSEFNCVVLDESGILKCFTSATRNMLIEKFANTPYKMCCSATPAPNDTSELANTVEFLGIMSRTELLATYFTHDSGETSKWRLKGYGESKFWEFMATIAVCVRNPADLGYSSEGFELPKLNIIKHIVKSEPKDYEFIAHRAETLSERREARKESLLKRVQVAKELVDNSEEQWIIWCDYNIESSTLHKEISDNVEIVGSDSPEKKADTAVDFAEGKIHALISKGSIYGMGMNFQNCHNMIFCGISDCYDEKTQILTHSGYKYFSELKMTDEVATINPETYELEYQFPERIIYEHYNGEMIRFKNKGFDLLVTPNHKLFVRKPIERYRNTDNKYHLKYAVDVYDEYKRMCYTMLSAPKKYCGVDRKSVVIDVPPEMRINTRSVIIREIEIHDYVKLVGWYLSEGYCRPLDSQEAGRIVICQTDKHPEHRNEIISLMEKIGLHVNHKTKDITGYSYNLAKHLIDNYGSGCAKLHMQQWLKDLPKEHLIVLRDTMLKGDGCHDDGVARFYRTNSIQLAEDFYEITLKTGLKCVLREIKHHSDKSDNPCYDVEISWHNSEPYIATSPTKEWYEGMIGCVTVPNHVVIVRRNGKSVVSGNSYENFYQSVRRCWRYGQKHDVNVHIIISEAELNVLDNIERKQALMDEMQNRMIALMHDVTMSEIRHTTRITTEYNPKERMELPKWMLA